MSRPVDPTLIHGRLSGATAALEAVRHARFGHVEYVGQHRAHAQTPPEFRAPFMTKIGGLHAARRDVEMTDLIIWQKQA